MVQNENKSEHKPPPIEHTSPKRNTPEELSSILHNRTLRGLTQLINPYKRKPSDSLVITLKHLIHCYD